MTTKPIGLYVHIPFCLKKCNYCDFCSFKIDEISWQDKYISRLCDEIESYKGQHIAIDTIFVGGGTPSLLSEDQFARVFSAIKESFNLTSDIEFTIEANPKTLTEEKLQIYRSCGVNRISVGLQSIHENEMKKLGRIHNYEDFLASYKLIRGFGFDNVNIDLMYGIPYQTIESFSQTLDEVIALSPEHISVYGLIVEENTPFARCKDELSLPDEEMECEMYYLACNKLAKAGYSHYEISNYARNDKFSKHNLKYWLNREYIGVGVSAHSYFSGIRYGNSDSVPDYLEGRFAKNTSLEKISVTDEAYDYVMLSLRLSQGFSLSEYKMRFGCDFLEGRTDFINSLISSGLMRIDDDRISLTDKGFYVSNSILTELI